ncbi:MAG: hypothetical protein NVSMB52_00990 [Chloroflexota bacterium]
MVDNEFALHQLRELAEEEMAEKRHEVGSASEAEALSDIAGGGSGSSARESTNAPHPRFNELNESD